MSNQDNGIQIYYETIEKQNIYNIWNKNKEYFNIDYIKECIAQGDNPFITNILGHNILMDAVIQDNIELTKFMLDLGANPNVRNKIEMPLFVELTGGHSRNKKWQNMLLYYYKSSFPENTEKHKVLKHLFDKSNDLSLTIQLQDCITSGLLSVPKLTPLLKAVINKNYEMAELLLKYGAKAKFTDHHNNSAIREIQINQDIPQPIKSIIFISALKESKEEEIQQKIKEANEYQEPFNIVRVTSLQKRNK